VITVAYSERYTADVAAQFIADAVVLTADGNAQVISHPHGEVSGTPQRASFVIMVDGTPFRVSVEPAPSSPEV
jgi:hypothetical protein